MLIVISLLAVIGLLATFLSLSLLKTWRLVLPLCFVVAVVLYGVHSFVAQVNFQEQVCGWCK